MRCFACVEEFDGESVKQLIASLPFNSEAGAHNYCQMVIQAGQSAIAYGAKDSIPVRIRIYECSTGAPKHEYFGRIAERNN